MLEKEPNAYDLVITDMNMPDLNGKQLIEQMREIRPDIPIVVCTGFSDNILQEQRHSLQVEGFLMKPVLRNVMAKSIRSILDHSGLN